RGGRLLRRGARAVPHGAGHGRRAGPHRRQARPRGRRVTDFPLFPFAELAPGTARKAEIDGLRICVVRINDDVYAIGDICTHQNISLSEGEVLTDTKEIECWKHGSAFSLEDGTPHALPATRAEPVFKTSVVDGQVVVSIDE